MTPFLGAGAVVADTDGAILLVTETGALKKGLWSLPAGKVEPGESGVAAMQREVREETGINVGPVDLLGIYHSVRTLEGVYGLNLVYRAVVIDGTPTASAEHPEVRFVDRGEIDTLLAQGRFRSGELMEAVLADFDGGHSLSVSTVRTLGVTIAT